MQSVPKRKATMPGLGERARAEDAPTEDRQNIACPPPSIAYHQTVEVRPPPSSPSASSPPPSSPPPQSGLQAKHDEERPSRRSPIRVDCVGDAAIALASRTRRSSVPRPAAKPPDAASAPLAPESLRVLFLIDGRTSIDGLSEATGIPPGRVASIVDRLGRLGFLARP